MSNPTPEFSDILWRQTKFYDPEVFLLTKIKPEYSDILYNPTYFAGHLVCWMNVVTVRCRIAQVPLYLLLFKFDVY
jgi:hypothetical protein